jgi:two-component system, LuxR family, sensor kinase FixL
MPPEAKPIRIAILVAHEEVSCRPVSLPFSLEGYPSIQVELFWPEAEPGPGLAALQDLRPEEFDLILDWQNLAPGEARPNLVTGPAVAILEELICQLQELRQKQEINVGVINSATDAIVTINEHHVIVGYNLGAEKVFGYTREEALGQDLSIIIPTPHKAVHQEYVRRFLATREARVIGKHVRLNAQRRDGREFPMSISFSVAEIRGNFYFTGIVRDITETREMEERLLRSEKLAAVGDTVARITHEIKNPLLIIGGFARQLLKLDQLDDKGRQKLRIIAEEVSRLEALMAEMRDFVRPPATKKIQAQLDAVLDDTLEFFKETFAEHHIEVRRLKEGPLPAASFDPQQIRQVLLNLFKNALEAMPRGGTITIASRVQGSNLEISVTDTGAGMSSEVAANIFQPYYTTKEGGTGLGLSICSFIVEKEHGGCLKAESTPGQGATFTIQLPLEEETAA